MSKLMQYKRKPGKLSGIGRYPIVMFPVNFRFGKFGKKEACIGIRILRARQEILWSALWFIQHRSDRCTTGVRDLDGGNLQFFKRKSGGQGGKILYGRKGEGQSVEMPAFTFSDLGELLRSSRTSKPFKLLYKCQTFHVYFWWPYHELLVVKKYPSPSSRSMHNE